jgi:DNA polymerase III subunit alpha
MIEEAKASPFYQEELEVINSLPDGWDYYNHIIDNVEIDRSNPNNSYVMYIRGKVDRIDLSKPCRFVESSTALPDIDVDFPTDYREKAIEYVRSKYGEDQVCQIATFGRYSGRSAIKAVMRAEGTHDYDAMDKVTAEIPDEAAISDQLEETGEDSIIMWVLRNDPDAVADFARLECDEIVGDYAEVFRKAIRLEGTFQNQGKHAAGVIISSEKVDNVCPMTLSKDGSKMAHLDMGDLEKLGLVKFDFLGVDILNKIQEAWGVDIIDVPLDDEEAWDTLCSGNTKGCFQVESHLGREWAREIAPRNMLELSDVIAGIRPGCLLVKDDVGRSMTKVYADRKKGIEEVPDNVVNNIVTTQGVLIYQETLLNIAKQLAGFSSANSIKLMKSVGKKDAKVLFSLQKSFIEGCVKVGKLNEQEATTLFENIKKSARYLFNLSHSVSYSYPAYWSAYIKAHKPLAFYETWLKYSSHKLDPHAEVRNLVMSARLDNIEILPPSCQYLTPGFFIRGEVVVFGLTHIKNVSEKELEKLFKLMRHYGVKCSLLTYLTQILPKVNKRTVEALIECGCFSYLGVSRSAMLLYYHCISDLTDKELAYFEGRGDSDIIGAIEFSAKTKKEGGAAATAARVPKILAIVERLRNPGRNLLDTPGRIATMEEEKIGIPLSCSYMEECMQTGIADTTCKELKRGKLGKSTVVARVKEVKEHSMKNGKKMAFLVIEDDTCEVDNVVCFNEAYEAFSHILYEGAMVAILGEIGKKKSFVIDRVVEL